MAGSPPKPKSQHSHSSPPGGEPLSKSYTSSRVVPNVKKEFGDSGQQMVNRIDNIIKPRNKGLFLTPYDSHSLTFTKSLVHKITLKQAQEFSTNASKDSPGFALSVHQDGDNDLFFEIKILDSREQQQRKIRSASRNPELKHAEPPRERRAKYRRE
ncbi:uncharacterized protein EAE98_012089 [Botrytis deweyae]|uniref:Uncharacterized protein n=1 Tax=Botrytis deweyae TaxID=2478750 RepID=A0ABQ7I3Z9_9HELO|nr:uncharacterized protein EAE98_012089 [Botrytis deweyae]KAF7910402.1 hypothetical protein EAE98_012089 [Botrytis deweyae]